MGRVRLVEELLRELEHFPGLREPLALEVEIPEGESGPAPLPAFPKEAAEELLGVSGILELAILLDEGEERFFVDLLPSRCGDRRRD
jgi:hypothetical protein